MKVLGIGGGDTLVVQMTELELCRILGFNSLYDDAYKQLVSSAKPAKYGEKPNLIGVELDVDKLASKVSALRWREAEAKKAAGTLRSLVEALEVAWPALVVSPQDSAP